ncbi:hypothetical protein ACA910_010717 [Epithemia clementina (nom. ined.)]
MASWKFRVHDGTFSSCLAMVMLLFALVLVCYTEATIATTLTKGGKYLRATNFATEKKGVDTSSGYDYIIVGGGLAGCVLAERLSHAFHDKRILIIEAGRSDYNHLFIRIPLVY